HPAGLGISLIENGNNNQAFPVLSAATSSGSSTTIQGTLTSAPDTAYALDFFSNAVCHPSGFGEGEKYLDTAVVTTNANGTIAFTVTLGVQVPTGQFVTATATDPSNNTSQFSNCQVVTGTAAPDLPAPAAETITMPPPRLPTVSLLESAAPLGEVR